MAEQPGNQTPSTADAGAAEVRERPVEEPRESETAELRGTADVATDPVREVITIPDDADDSDAFGESDAADSVAGGGVDTGTAAAGNSEVPEVATDTVDTTDTEAADVTDAGNVEAADVGTDTVVDATDTNATDTDTSSDTNIDTVGTAEAGDDDLGADGGDAEVDAGSDSEDVGAGPDGGHVRIGEETSSSIKYSQEITSPEDEPEREGRSLATTHHEVIKQWAEERGGTPATVDGTEHGDHLGVLRLDFGGKNQNLRHVSWEEWFETFDARRLNFIYQEQRRDGHQSNFFRLESPDREDG